MSALTSRLSLTKPGGGSTGKISPGETVDIDVLNANFDTIDLAVGAISRTSTSRPVNPFNGMLLYETDTRSLVRYNGSSWDYLIGRAAVSSAGSAGSPITMGASGTAALTTVFTVASTPYAQLIEIVAQATVTAQASQFLDVIIRKNGGAGGAGLIGRVSGLGTGYASFTEVIPANASVTYQLVGTNTTGGATTVTNNPQYTGMTISATPSP